MRRRALLGLAATPPLLVAADAPPPLSEAQILLFETPHLAGLQPPLRLDYGFTRDEPGREPVRDRIRLQVTAGEAEGRFDVSPEFLTGARAIRYPVAHGFRGNPLLLFALDRDAREMSAATGGSIGWFRNHLRRAFAEAAPPRRVMLDLAGRAVPASEILLEPFADEPRARLFRQRRYRFVLAEAVPGWIQGIATDMPADDAGGRLREEIRFAGASPAAEGAG
ncbi:hypothetical protein [Paracraurococcus ruber]|nr:hypothetical protein [Paracraurococcus ruber]TDG33082.1 hypothetical protein E2C05_04840 [Paracraurococcus ruber]